MFKNFFGGEFGLIQQFHWAWEIFEKSMKKMFQTLSITEKLSDLHSVWTGWLVFLRRIDFWNKKVGVPFEKFDLRVGHPPPRAPPAVWENVEYAKRCPPRYKRTRLLPFFEIPTRSADIQGGSFFVRHPVENSPFIRRRSATPEFSYGVFPQLSSIATAPRSFIHRVPQQV